MYWIPSTVLKVSPIVLKLFPHMYCCYPPTLLKLSLHSTEGIPTVLKLFPHMYCCYPPHYWNYPSTVLNTAAVLMLSPTVLMLSSHVLMLFPTVLNNFHSTEAIPHCNESCPPIVMRAVPPQYWCYPSDVLNNLQCTEQPPLYSKNPHKRTTIFRGQAGKGS